MKAGLDVLKFSLDAMDERKIQKIRGKKANFAESIDKILKIIKFKKENNLKTLLVPCMIDLATEETDIEMHKEFLEFWKDKDVFAYIKSQDNRWLHENDKDLKSRSHYSKQYCEYPWLSLTIMADGNVVPCTQISNNELVLGNVKENTLEEIWNGEKYKELRKMHVTGKFPKGHKCNEKCDMNKLYSVFSLIYFHILMTQTPFIKIGKRNIGLAYKPLIIPEIGINHNGSLEIAFKMVDAAKKEWSRNH